MGLSCRLPELGRGSESAMSFGGQPLGHAPRIGQEEGSPEIALRP